MKHLSPKTVAKAKKIIKIEKQIHDGEISREDAEEQISKITSSIPLEELMSLDDYIYTKLNEKI